MGMHPAKLFTHHFGIFLKDSPNHPTHLQVNVLVIQLFRGLGVLDTQHLQTKLEHHQTHHQMHHQTQQPLVRPGSTAVLLRSHGHLGDFSTWRRMSDSWLLSCDVTLTKIACITCHFYMCRKETCVYINMLNDA